MKKYMVGVGILVIALVFTGTAQATWCNSKENQIKGGRRKQK